MLISSFSEEQLENNLFLFFIAGHETTAAALSWALYLLARHPDVQKRVQDELDSVLKGNHVDNDSVKELWYLDMVIKEVLRWGSPIAIIVSRKAQEDIQIDKYVIPKDTPIALGIHAVHHHPEFWPNPEVFDPERFAPNKATKQHPFAFLPFSLGRRVCIGNNFSLLEQKIFLSTLLQKFTISVPPNSPPYIAQRESIAHTPTEVKIILTKRK